VARINEFRKARRGRRVFLLVVGALLALAVLQVGTSSALVPADLVDTYAEASYTTPKTTFAPGETVYARGGLAGSTGSYRFLYTNPSATVVRDSGCVVRNLSDSNAFDSLTLAANAPAGTWTLRFIEYGSDPPRDTTCTSVVRDRSRNFFVVQTTPTVSTTIHNSGHTAVTSVAVGSTVHDFVSVGGGTGNPVPTGNVTIDWFLNGTCTGSPASTSVAVALDASGNADVAGFAFTVNSAGDRAFLAHYAGGGPYVAADGPCETLHVVNAKIDIAPLSDTNPVGASHVLTITVTALNGTIDAGPHTATATLSGAGGFVPAIGGDTCTYAGGGATASCQVTISSSATGTSTVSATSNIPVNGQTITRTTDTLLNTAAGGGGNATKYWADDAVTTVIREPANNDVGGVTLGGGFVIHDEATVTKTSGTPASVPNPTGTVDFTLYDNGTCNGNVVASDPNKPLGATGIATSATFTIPAAVGTYSYLAHYNGDANYPAHDGPCEPFDFDGVRPMTSITLDPSQPDTCCWYTFAVKPTVSATDVGTGLLETHCQLDGTPPANYVELVDNNPGMCPYLAPSSWIMTEGVHTLCAGSIDKATPGNTDLVCVTFKIDRTPPTSQVDPLPQFQPNPGAFNVSWTGSDNLSGIKDFDVRYRVAPAGGSFGPYTQWFTDTTQTSASFTPTPGSTVCFSVKARDRACWEQPTYSPEVCTTAPYDDPSLARTGSWSTVSGSGYFGPGVSRSTSSGNKLTLAGLRASVVGVLVTKQPGAGTIELRWNGSTKLSTSLGAATVQKKQLLTFTLPSVQTGTLEIVQTGSGAVEIDAAGAWKAS
jgi:hypothetical protein